MPIDNQPIPGQQPGTDTGTPGIRTPAALKKPKQDTLKLEKPSKSLKDIIDVSPTMKEATGKTAVFTFGRMNPPTTGHEKLIQKVADVAKQHGAKGHIVLSHSHDNKNNPIPQDKKIGYVQKINKNVHVHGSDKDAPNFLSQAKKFHSQGHDHLVMVAGSDRVGEYEKILNKYNGHPDHFNFKSIKVVSAGQRDPDSEGTTGISGTKMRAFAKSGDEASFKGGLPKALHGQHKQIMSHIKEYYEDQEILDSLTEEEMDLLIQQDFLNEQMINERVLNLMQRRKAALKMRRLKFKIQRMKKLKKKRMATLDMLTRRARRTARTFIRKRIAGKKGEQYADLSPSEKIQIDKRVDQKQALIDKIAKRLMPKVKQQELVRLRKARAQVKESVNKDFESFYASVSDEMSTTSREEWQTQNSINRFSEVVYEQPDPRVAQLKDKHTREAESTEKKHAIEREKLKAQMARERQAELRREAREIAEAVDTMVDALAALDEKARKGQVSLDEMFVVFVEGYQNPHGQQTPQQGGFAAVNKMLAEMSAAEKDKAEDIVKGMKKKASYFRKKYGADAKSVMYATANKMAQKEDFDTLRKELREKNGLWANIHAKRKRGEKMNPKGHPDAPTPEEMKKAQQKESVVLEAPETKTAKMQQLFRMGLAQKGELQIMMRALKGGEDSLKNPKLREKLYELLDKLVDIVTTNGEIFVKVRQSILKNRDDLQAVEELYSMFNVNNFIGVNKAFENLNTSQACCDDCESLTEELIEEDAVYIDEEGKKENVKLNKIQRGGSKKFYVYTKNDKGNVVKVSFGDPNLSIKRDDPERRKSFRARHNCDDPGPKWKARYWSCRQWRAGAKVED